MNICVAVKEKLTKDSGVAGAGAYDHIVDKLLNKQKARGKINLVGNLNRNNQFGVRNHTKKRKEDIQQ